MAHSFVVWIDLSRSTCRTVTVDAENTAEALYLVAKSEIIAGNPVHSLEV